MRPGEGRSGGACITWLGFLSLSVWRVLGGPTCENWSSSVEKIEQWKAAQIHVEDKSVHWGLQRTFVTSAEERGQNRLDNYLSTMKTENISANGNSEVDQISQWILNLFHHPWIGETDNISELSKPLGHNPQSIHNIRTLGRYWVTVPQARIFQWLGSCVWLLPYLPLPPDTGKKK